MKYKCKLQKNTENGFQTKVHTLTGLLFSSYVRYLDGSGRELGEKNCSNGQNNSIIGVIESAVD